MQRKTLTVLIAVLALAACRKWAPDDLDYLSPRAVYNQKVFSPVMGRTTLYAQIFNTDNSSTPIQFKITNVRYKTTGEPTTDLATPVEALVWKQAYTGEEKSIAEIDAKRVVETHPAWEIRPNSGEFILWAAADNSVLREQPDSGYLFDVEASNSGGKNVYTDLAVMPYREQPYAPYEYDPVTGLQRANYPNPSDSSVYKLIYNNPGVQNVTDDETNLALRNDSIRVLFHRKGDGSSLTFKFMDKDSMAIDPAKFNRTAWDTLVHGFNRVTTKTEVRYDVAYPIPLVRYRTRYTNGDGSQAYVKFIWDRIGFGNIRETCSIDLNFSIFRKGDWEIIFFFQHNPRFRDE